MNFSFRDELGRQRAANMVANLPLNGKRWVLEWREADEKRRDAQNRLMWAMLADISAQILWSVNGQMQRLDPEEWKDLLTASLTSEMRVAQGVNGGIVLLGKRTSKMTVKEMTNLIELMYAFGTDRGVRFTASEDAA
jgi:hypothetical protein